MVEYKIAGFDLLCRRVRAADRTENEKRNCLKRHEWHELHNEGPSF